MKPELLAAIRTWVDEVIASRNYDRDLHVTDLGKEFADQSTWIDAGCECFATAVEHVKARRHSFYVIMSWSLGVSDEPIGFPFKTRHDVEKYFDHQPPWLRLLPTDFNLPSESRRDDISATELLGCTVDGAKIRYNEYFYESSGEYGRFLWVQVLC